MAQAKSANTPKLPSLATAVPASYAVHHSGWIPVIVHPDRVAPYTREERFRRKVKATAIEAVDYAAKAIAWRKHFADYRHRKIEAIAHPQWLQAAE